MSSLVRALALVIALGSLSPGIAAEGISGSGWQTEQSFGWGTAQVVDTNGSGRYPVPQVSVDGKGNATAVWEQYDGVRTNISSNRYEVGRGWGTSQLIETDDAGDASSPHVSSDGSGNAIAVWHQSVDRFDSEGNRLSPNVFHIWANRYAIGMGWGSAQLIETDDSSQSYDPQVAMNGAGNAIAVWRQSSQIWSNRYVAGTGWGTAELIGNTPDYALNPQVSMDGSGNAIVVWDTFGYYCQIWSNRYVVGTGWGVEELIQASDSEELPAFIPQVSMDSSGNAIAVWFQHRGNPQDTYAEDIWSNRYVVGSGWGIAELIETDISADAHYPQVSMDSSGNATAVWSLYENDDPRSSSVWSNRYVVGTGWGAEEPIQANGPGEFVYQPQVSMDSSGNAIAVWVYDDDFHFNISSSRYEVGRGWGPPQLIEMNDEDAQSPQVSVDGSGNAIVVWSQSSQIWSNRYAVLENAPSSTNDISPLVFSVVVIMVAAVALTIVFLAYRRMKKLPPRKSP